MKMPRFPDRNTLLEIAEVIDAWRIVPRIILVAYGYLVWYVINWFLVISNPDTGQTALAVSIAGSIPVVIGLYQHSGRSWGPHGNRSFRNQQPKVPAYNPTYVLPQIQPNINMGTEPQAPAAGGPAGKSAGPYDDRDFEDRGE